MKFQVFLIAVVVMMTGGAIAVAQSVPSGYRAGGAPSNRIQIPPAADTSTAGEAQLPAPQAGATTGLSPATVVAIPSGIESPAASAVNRTDAETATGVSAACVAGHRSHDQRSLGLHLAAPAGLAADVRGHGAKARCAAAAVSGGQVRHGDDEDQDAEGGN